MPNRFPFNTPNHPEDNRSINKAFDRNYGNRLKSGDTTTLKYTIKDGDGEPLDKERLPGMQTSLILKYEGVTAYETDFEAALEEVTENYVGDLVARFRIDEALPPSDTPYVVEFHFEDDEDLFIFPSVNTLELYITPSALNSDGEAIKNASEQRLNEIVERKLEENPVLSEAEANELARQENYQELLDTGVMQTKINERLEDLEEEYAPKLTEVTAQLAQKASIRRVDSYNNTPKSLTVSGGGNTKPFISFVDDDGRSTCYDTLFPLFESKEIVGTAAVTVNQIGSESSFMTKDNLLELQDNGWEIASHNYDEVYFGGDNLTIEEIDYQARKSKEVLSDWGLAVNNYVYTGGQMGNHGFNETVRIIKKYYRSAYNTVPEQNKFIDDFHRINRVDGDRGTLSSLKAEVDKCLAENNWLVFMIHSGTHNAERTQIISDLIDYIKSKNIGIGTLNDGLEIFGSTFNIGSKETITTMSNGEIRGNAIGAVFRAPMDGYDIDENTPINGFETNKITISPIQSSDGINMPSPLNEGILTTLKPSRDIGYVAYQTWQQYNREAIYKRRWEGTYPTGQWGDWISNENQTFTKDVELGPIPANSTIEVELEHIGLKREDIVQANPRYTVGSGIIWTTYAFPDKVKIRFMNITDVEKDIRGQPWLISIIKELR